MMKDFKTFIARGNVIDLAVGVIIGGAFGKIVTSLVTDIITPVIGLITGGVDLSGRQTRIGGTDAAPVYMHWGSFIQSAVDFFIIAVVIFLFVKVINAMRQPTPEPPPSMTKDQALLTEIRDELKRR